MNIRLLCVVVLVAGCAAGPAYPQAPADVAEQISKAAPSAAAGTPAPRRPTCRHRWPIVADGGPAGTVPAIWVAREVSFTYFSTTSLYYCDGLRNKVKWVHEAARADGRLQGPHPVLLQHGRTGDPVRACGSGVLFRRGVPRRGW